LFSEGVEQKIIFNERIDNSFVTVIFNIQTLEKEVLPMSYYAMDSSRSFALCVDNERHYFFRPNYSYKGIKNLTKNRPILDDDGIWFIDIKTKKISQIVTLKQMLKIRPLSNMNGAVHYLEHLMISPNGRRFIFLHRWRLLDGGVYSRLYTADIDGNNIYLLNDSGRVSHQCWKNSEEIVAWAGLSNPINSLRKYKKIVKFFINPLMPLYKKISGGNSVEGNTKFSSLIAGDSYVTFKDKTNLKIRLAKDVLKSDGHPSFSKSNERLMVTDTYPINSKNNKQELILFDILTNSIVTKNYLKHDKYSQSPMRCDLHPNWSPDGKMVSIDTIDGGHRSINVYEI
jgi:hypothetical protein